MRALSPQCLLAMLLVGLGACGGGAGEDPDAGDETDAEAPPTVCARNADCDDGLFCNGAERCDPATSGRDDGCVSLPPPCAADVCHEASDDCSCGTDADSDGDGSASPGCGGDDCDDADANRYPGNAEVCDAEGHDEDCDPVTLAGASGDADADGHVSTACCGPGATAGAIVCGTDCDDDANAVNPGTAESCNGVDDDCDGDVDESVIVTFYADVDEDLYGDPDVSMTGCAAPSGFVQVAGDCDDTDRMVSPAGSESCDGTDQDCDELIDEEAEEIGTRAHCSACGNACQFECNAGTRTCARVTSLSAGRQHPCVSLDTGSVFCWGYNSNWQVEESATEWYVRPTRVPLPSPSGPVSAGRQVTCSATYVAALDRVTAYCWGNNDQGQAGGTPAAMRGPARVPITEPIGDIDTSFTTGCAVVDPAGTKGVRCWGSNITGLLDVTVSGAETISVESGTACAVMTGGTVSCWGSNERGRTGIGLSTGNQATPAAVSGLASVEEVEVSPTVACARTTAGEIRCWGQEQYVGTGADYGSCGLFECTPTPIFVPGLPPARDLSVGDLNTCIATTTGDVWCWGSASALRDFGSSTTEPIFQLSPVQIPGLANVARLATGGGYLCFEATSGEVSCVGGNGTGQLGDGTLDSRSTPAPVLPPLD